MIDNNSDAILQLLKLKRRTFDLHWRERTQSRRISEDDGLYLFEKAPLGYLGALANFIQRKTRQQDIFQQELPYRADKYLLVHLHFCSYSGLIKKRKKDGNIPLRRYHADSSQL